MNLDESATGTVGLLPHQLADLRRSSLSDDTIRVPIVITAELQKRCVGCWVGQIERNRSTIDRYCGLRKHAQIRGFAASLSSECPGSG